MHARGEVRLRNFFSSCIPQRYFAHYLRSRRNTTFGRANMNETTQVFYPARGRADLALRIPSPSRSQWWKRRLLSRAISQPLDRVHVLGNDLDYGHTGLALGLSCPRASGL